MKITTWNVNGIRARLTHIIDFLREHEPDVLCLQETKVVDDLFPLELLVMLIAAKMAATVNSSF